MPTQNRVLEALNAFFTTPLDAWLQQSLSADTEEAILMLFHANASSVPAYKAYLSEHAIDPGAIHTFADLQQLPALTKENYLRRHPLPDLCRHGRLEACDMIAVSSGSTGTPCFWPRFLTDELAIAWRFEQIFHDSFRADERRTLAVICFALGTWVGGMYTAACCRYLAQKGYPLTVITPGSNRDEILRVVQELGGYYDQVVLLGYPPFLKDVVDTGLARGVEWSHYRIKLVMAGEVFSEAWRDLVGRRVGSTQPCFDSASLYGTADAGVLGNETPLSICIRRYLAAHPEAARALFGESRLPTLVQYDPRSRCFESQDGRLLFSGDNGIPLVRYNILDTGGVVTYEAMLAFLKTQGFDPLAALEQQSGTEKSSVDENGLAQTGSEGDSSQANSSAVNGLVANSSAVNGLVANSSEVNGLVANGLVTEGAEVRRGVRPLPFVYVFGRSDFTVSYFGANIYPENITVGLEQSDVAAGVTGKFVLQVVEEEDHNRWLSIVVELAPGTASDEVRQTAIADSIRHHLLRLNSEFANYVPASYQQLRVRLTHHGDPDYFPLGVKHRYTRKERRPG